jgi:hypothetical protein
MMKFFGHLTLLLMVCLLTSFSKENEIEKRNKFFYKALAAMTGEIKASYDFRITCSGGSTLEGVRNFSFDVEVPQSITFEEARMYVVSCLEIALRAVNSFSEIRPYLVEYPFPADRINFGLYILSNEKKNNVVDTIYFSHGMFSYFSRNENGERELLSEESLEEALNKVRSGKIL